MRHTCRLLFLFLLLALPGALRGAAQLNSSKGDSTAWTLAESDPVGLMRKTTQNEITNTYGRRPPMRYELRKISGKSDTTKEIVETPQGGVARLLTLDGKPLTAEREKEELARLHTLAANPSQEQHRHRNELRDAAHIEKFARLLPDAFVYTYAGRQETAQGEMIRMTFTPNPKFNPPDFESHLLTGIRGEVWVAPQELRVVHIEGHVFKPVDFGWGILGSVNPGGTIRIDQQLTATCGWQMARLDLHFDGKALVFKTLHIDVEETATDYASVPANWTYQDAIRWLLAFRPRI